MLHQDKKFSGKVALVTGGAKRLGRAISLGLAELGCGVVVHYSTSYDDAQTLCEDIEKLGAQAWALEADFGDEDGCRGLVRRVVEHAGRVDFLINNASVFPADTMDSVTFESVVSCFKINVWAPFVLCREFAAEVGSGKIVNLLDTRIVGYDWAHVAYIWSKHVLGVMTKMCAMEFAPNIMVNAVAPGLILPPEGKDESYLERLKDTVPLKRYGNTDEIVRAVEFLVESDFITGQVIYVDGGRHIREAGGG